MKRSESILVYGVTGILVVILVVAVVFGGGEQRPAADPTDLLAGDPQSGSTEELARLAGVPENFVDANAEAEPGRDDAADPDAEAGGEPKPSAGESPLVTRTPSVQVLIGPCQTFEQPDGTKFRIVRVRQGETFSDIVQRFTGSLDRAAEVRALNEQLDPDFLRPDDSIWLPWVDDAELIAAWEARRGGPAARDPAPVADPRGTAGSAGTADPIPSPVRSGLAVDAAAARIHVVKPGESLWKIAEAQVGRQRANAYMQEIAQQNGIADMARIRAGQKLTLPPVE